MVDTRMVDTRHRGRVHHVTHAGAWRSPHRTRTLLNMDAGARTHAGAAGLAVDGNPVEVGQVFPCRDSPSSFDRLKGYFLVGSLFYTPQLDLI